MIKGKIIAGVIALLMVSMALGSVTVSSGTIWYQAPKEEHDYDFNKTISASDTTFSEDNYLALCAEVDDVYGPTTSYGDESDETLVEICVGATGHSEWYEDDYGSILHQKPHKVKIEATLSSHETPGHIDWQESYNDGLNVGGNKEPSNWKYDGPMSNTIKESAKTIVTSTPEGAIAMTAANFAKAIDEDTDNTKYIEDIDGDGGKNALIRQKWDVNKNDDDFVDSNKVALGVWEGTMNFTVSSKIYWTIPADLPKESYSISLSASLLMRENDGTQTTDKWGAETASVIFTMKNGEISSTVGSTNEISGDGTSTNPYWYETSNFDGTGYITPEFKVNAYSPNNPEVTLRIDWKSDGSYDTILSRKADQFPVTIDHTYYISSSSSYKIEFDLSVPDYQGGWECHKTVYIQGHNDEDDGGGGGGGGCPYVSPWTGDKYKRENNLLMDSEFENGEVTDKYLLENGLRPKNGSYQMKIEEFENSEDFIDQLQLYTLDHTKDTELGLTPEEKLVSYSKNDLNKPKSASLNDKSILEKVKEKNDKKRATIENNKTFYLKFGDITNYRWSQSKLVVTASGFESHTESDFSTNAEIKSLRSLYFSIRTGDGEWTDVDVVHPRNNPSDYVLPLKEAIQETGFEKGTRDSSLQVRINSTAKHNIDRIALDDSYPTPVKKKEASIREVIKIEGDGETIYQNKSLTEDDNAVMHLVPGESCTVTFNIPSQEPGNAFEERDFLVMTKGFYTKYEG